MLLSILSALYFASLASVSLVFRAGRASAIGKLLAASPPFVCPFARLFWGHLHLWPVVTLFVLSLTMTEMNPAVVRPPLSTFFFLLCCLCICTAFAKSKPRGCSLEVLQQCAEPLRQMGVPISKNLVHLLLQIRSPNQLRKSCYAYGSVLPCFRARISECGTASQGEILRQLENAHAFLCSQFSAQEQSGLLSHRICIGKVLGEVSSGNECEMGGTNSSQSMRVLYKCRERCNSGPELARFGCLVRTWLSEQNVCVSERMRLQCGRDAAAFYMQMQRKIFHPKFPLICNMDLEEEAPQRKETSFRTSTQVTPLTSSSSVRSTPPTIFVSTKKRKTVARLSEIRLKFKKETRVKGSAITKDASVKTTTIDNKTRIHTTSNPISALHLNATPTPSPLASTVHSSHGQKSRRGRIIQLLAQSLPFQLSAPSTASPRMSTTPPTQPMLFAPKWDVEQHQVPLGGRVVFFEVVPVNAVAESLQPAPFNKI